jgi:cytochrome c553
MGGTLTSFDCVVCHAEGTVNAGNTETTGDHANGVIDFWDVDDTAQPVFTYDKDTVAGSAGAAANWNSTDSEWRTATSTALDPFCLTCHDSDGATDTFNSTDGGSASNPFGDTLVTNNYDQVNRGGVVDIASKVSGNPPPQGQFSRHAIRGQSTSIYNAYQGIAGGNTMYEGDATAGQSLFTSMGTDEFGNPVWNDTSVMGCADCHTTDGANGAAGNAHGSVSEYLLKDASGGANEGTLAGLSYVCYRCHAVGRYQEPTGPLGKHTDNSGDWQDKTGLTGSERINNGKGSNVFAMACTNCHGGSGFGTIHGTSETFGVGEGGGSGTRNAYRFMNGASLRYYDPKGWTGTNITCYTLGSADSWGGCTQHNKGTNWTKPLQRPLTY